MSRKKDEGLGKYRVLQTFTLNEVIFNKSDEVFFTTIYKSTNSKNTNFCPEDLLEYMVNSGCLERVTT